MTRARVWTCARCLREEVSAEQPAGSSTQIVAGRAMRVLERLYFGPLVLAARCDARSVTAATARSLARRRLVRVEHGVASITDEGRRALAIARGRTEGSADAQGNDPRTQLGTAPQG